MSGYCTGLVLRHSRMKGASRLVMVAIADMADDGGTNAWPSVETIAALAALNRRTAQRAIEECIESGELTRSDHSGGPSSRRRQWRTHRYALPLLAEWARGEAGDNPPEGRRDAASTNGREGRRETASTNGLGRHPVPLEAVSSTARGGERPPDPSLPVLDPSLLRATDLEEIEDPLRGFDEFWKAYPKRDGKKIGRGKCEERWKKLSLRDRKDAWRGACYYRDACLADLTRAKDPDRWLRDRCWEDWQTAAVPDNRRRDPMTGRHSTSLAEEAALALGGG